MACWVWYAGDIGEKILSRHWKVDLKMVSEKLLYWASKPVVKTYSNVMLDLDVERRSALPRGAKIFAPNHPTTTDPFFVAAMVGEQSFILINNLLFQVPVLGTYLRRAGHIPVKAGEGQQAIDRALEYLEKGYNIIIFPEGALSPEEGGFCKPKTGVARIALASGAPVIPVGIHLDKSRVHTVRSTVKGQVEYGRWYLRGPYAMTAGAPLYFHGDPGDRELVRSVSNTVMHHIIELARESEIRLTRTPDALGTLASA